MYLSTELCIDSVELVAVVSRKGGRLLWIAPSGGRDRPNPATNEWFPVRFLSSLLVFLLLYLIVLYLDSEFTTEVAFANTGSLCAGCI